MPYNLFEFDDGAFPTSGSLFMTLSGAAHTFVDDGVQFTYSVKLPGLVTPVNPPGTGTSPLQGAMSASFFGPGPISISVQAHQQGNPSANTFLITGAQPFQMNLVLGMPVTGASIALTHSTNPIFNVAIPLGAIPPLPSINLTVPLVPGHEFTAVKFTGTAFGAGRIGIEQLGANINCFCAGTRIATKDGDIAVEDLQPGHRIKMACGQETEVQWLGKQSIDTRLQHPTKVNPICISADALANGVPKRDLYVSPDHAIEIDGQLINASALVNGHSIYQVRDMPQDGFTYYHVETQRHELILAEGCPVESYIDVPDRSAFDNGAERAEAPAIQEMELPRISSARLVPLAIRERLNDRVSATQPRAA